MTGSLPGAASTDQYLTSDRLDARVRLHTEFSQHPCPWQRWIFDQLALPGEASLLELGGGTGALWLENRERLSPRWTIRFTDASPGMMMVARDVLPELAPAFTFDVVDAARLPFEDASFDVVIANHMLYHVEDRPRAFREICRVLKPGGRLYASTVGEQHMLELWSWVEQVHPGIIAWTRGAVAGFTLENGRGQLAPYFSKVILARYQDELHVTEVEPLVAYVQSVIEGSRFALSDVRLAAFRNLVQQRLQRRGYLRIGKAVGLFTAASPTL